MPDLLTHYTAAYFLTRSSAFLRFRAVFYFGTILPDIISRPVYILFPKLAVYTVAMHTPVFLFILCLFLTELFHKEIKENVRNYLFMGVLLHLILDLLQKHHVGGYFWFFPFSWKTFEIGLFWPDTPLQLTPVWISLILMTEGIYYMKKRKGV
ncbi:metal-dependent hydrolase [candidate division KSB1 bacterium]|nr:metal-dependent hydrolase [candidate division KSB1 bacterium]